MSCTRRSSSRRARSAGACSHRTRAHVFDKFYRVKNTATSEIAGIGLGLAITKSIVEAYGGRISVQSLEGAGTTCVVELVLAQS
jgi:two-component system OmpR family sensor kinase